MHLLKLPSEYNYQFLDIYSFPEFLDFSIDTAAIDIRIVSYTSFKVSKNSGNEYI